MSRTLCEVCHALVEITPTGQRVSTGWSSERWRVVVHATKDAEHKGVVCAGSGRVL